MRNSHLPSQNEWLNSLARAGPDLELLVGDMRNARRSVQNYNDFQREPFQRNGDGKMRFIVPSENDRDINLLEVFDGDIDSVRKQYHLELSESTWGRMIMANNPRGVALCAKTQDGLFLEPEYLGPKLFLYPDTNVELNAQARKFLKSIAQGDGIEYDTLTIVNYEKSPGGLLGKFRNLIPADLARGQQSLEKRLPRLNKDQQDSINLFFDLVSDYFDRETGDIFRLADQESKETPEILARKLAHEKGKNGSYERFARKLIEKRREGNSSNYLADKILASTSFGFNLVNQRDKSIVISDDADLSLMFDTLYDEVLPRYMAATAVRTMESKGEKRYSGSEPALCEAARAQIRWARNLVPEDNTSLGVLYVPGDNRFYVKEASSALRHFFNGLSDYRHGKSELITEMAASGESPEKVIERLVAGQN